MKQTATFFLILISILCEAQTRDLSTLPRYDCSLTKLMAIISKPTILVSADSNNAFAATLRDYCLSIGTNCLRKKEGELTSTEFSKNLLLVGVLTDFKKWKDYKTPIIKTDKGFRVNNKDFQNKNDGFGFVANNRIIISGNSIKAVKDALLAFTGGHDIVITQSGKITFFGNANRKQFNWYNLQNLKASNYIKKPSELFSAIYVSKTFKDTIDYLRLNSELTSYARQFLSLYHVKMPAKKVGWFIHSNMAEYGTMSGMFGLTCPGNNSAGFSIRGEIHTNGTNVGLVKHEYSHFLFDHAIPQDNNRAFFIEGCVEYVTNLNDNALFKQRVEIAKKYQDTLNYADLIIDNKDFYGQYSDANYSISGVLVKYIIDSFGIEAFKSYCLAIDKQSATKIIFKKRFEELIDNYKIWLDKQ